ncbi:unnamed protein product [Leuciscus chuanchicus]
MCCQFGGFYGQLELQKFGALRLAVYSGVCRSHYGRPGLAKPQQQCTADQRPLRNDTVLSFKKAVGVTIVRKQSPHVDRGGILQWSLGKRECERKGKSGDLSSASFHRKQS